MNFSEFVFVIAVYLFNVQYTSSNFVDDYCWRDYNGVMPLDALKAGIARDGRPIYIGQTLFDNKIIPGKIHENVNEIHIEFFQAFIVNETIKILCSDHPEKFEWLKTQYNKIIDMKDTHIFEGGYEDGVTTYIGRAQSHGELTVGKVVCWVDRCIQLTTIENGTWYPHDDFEILVYKPKTDDNPSSYYGPEKASFLTYFFLLLVTALLVALVVVLVRRC